MCTYPENIVKIGPVYSEIIGGPLTEEEEEEEDDDDDDDERK